MRRPIISRRLWWTLTWSAAIALGLGFQSEVSYRDRVVSLPQLVDEHGNTASVETAMAALDSYESAKQVRRFGFVSLGVGAVLFICAITVKREDAHDT
jgi:hypothetical protein